MILSETKFLEKIASFTKIALSEIEELENRLYSLRKKEAAIKLAEEEKESKLNSSLVKAAEALYETDFLTDEFEKRKFLKKAKEDPSYLATMLERVCKAADVSLMGSPSQPVIKASSRYSPDDPVARRAFGFGSGSVMFDE